MTTIRLAQIKPRSLVDGPGERTVVFLQGCPLACPGCQSPHLWPANGGKAVQVEDLAETVSLLAINGNVTLSGGEIFTQPAALAELVTALRARGVDHIICYSGYTLEELTDPTHPAYPWVKTILENIDVLVDGRFVKALDDPFITYRGSRNQRPIDVWATLTEGYVVTLDWDTQFQISETGEIVLPAGLAREFAQIGAVHSSRMCGQVSKV